MLRRKTTGTVTRGFFGIGIYYPKSEVNVGGLWRSAMMLGASFIYTIGREYEKQSMDTQKTHRHLPLFHFLDFDCFYESLPAESKMICIEQTAESKSLFSYNHPERAVYLLGMEDHGLPDEVLDKSDCIVHIPMPASINVHVCGSIVMYDRILKKQKSWKSV